MAQIRHSLHIGLQALHQLILPPSLPLVGSAPWTPLVSKHCIIPGPTAVSWAWTLPTYIGSSADFMSSESFSDFSDLAFAKYPTKHYIYPPAHVTCLVLFIVHSFFVPAHMLSRLPWCIHPLWAGMQVL